MFQTTNQLWILYISSGYYVYTTRDEILGFATGNRQSKLAFKLRKFPTKYLNGAFSSELRLITRG